MTSDVALGYASLEDLPLTTVRTWSPTVIPKPVERMTRWQRRMERVRLRRRKTRAWRAPVLEAAFVDTIIYG